ncbi:MAG TPA: phosphatase PAP2 family protein [Gemmatimonadales bacterium]|jgi:membrane-associated phospholipid phosphatase|nr:phosphatase PAP2 family protein [Gemmatimonadales bacterium]
MGLSYRARVQCFHLAIACAVVLAPRAEAQSHSVRWWEAAVAIGAVGVVSLADRGTNDWIQDHRSARSDDVARVFRNGGQPEVVFGLSGAILAAGVVSGRLDQRRRGGRVLASVAVAGLTTAVIKAAVGRLRPGETSDPYRFKPFAHHDAFPSGHATLAFALATSLSEEIDRPWATAALYAGATGTAWSRLNDKRHWLSDVLAGATVGITTAKVIEGRWHIFGLGPPRFLVDPDGTRLEWRVAF